MTVQLSAHHLSLGAHMNRFHYEGAMPKPKDGCTQKITKAFQTALASQAVGHIEAKVSAVIDTVKENSAVIESHTGMIARLDLDATQHKATHNMILDELRKLSASVQEMAMVKLNGGPPVKLSDALRVLYEQTEGVRTSAKLMTSWERWQKHTKLGRILSSPLGKFFGAFIFIYAALAVLYSFGAQWAEPKGLIIKIVGLLPF